MLSLFLTILFGGRRFSLSGLWWGEEVFRKCFGVERFTKASSSDTRFWNKANCCKKKILEQKGWIRVTDSIDITEFKHLDKKWQKERRYVAVRQEVNEKPKATGKFMSLLFELSVIRRYLKRVESK